MLRTPYFIPYDLGRFYTLAILSPQEYRRSKLFGSTENLRAWLQVDTLFQHGPHGTEELSADGEHRIAHILPAVFKFSLNSLRLVMSRIKSVVVLAI